ncbi:MAG: hypothetical protein U5M23_08460 [Marinagarivorans sp.]|nr:hypothetical protein [Marinagarivorans sp.]
MATGGNKSDFLAINGVRLAIENHVIGGQKTTITKLDVGTHFLTQLRSILPYALLENIGILSPALMREIVLNKPLELIEYAQHVSMPLACVNLCASLEGLHIQGVVANDALYGAVVNVLLASRGEVINKHQTKNPNESNPLGF